MAKTFKKGQPIIATLPSGRRVQGIYIEPYGTDGHSFFLNEMNGIDHKGNAVYKKVRYGVKDENIDPLPNDKFDSLDSPYKMMLKRATVLEERIKEYNDTIRSLKRKKVPDDDISIMALRRKMERSEDKLFELNCKITEYENNESY